MPKGPQALTANLLRSGDVVYLTGDGRWARDLGEAAVAPDAASAEQLEAVADAAVSRQEVIGPYLFDVDIDAGRAVARSVREKIRAAHGPTV